MSEISDSGSVCSDLQYRVSSTKHRSSSRERRPDRKWKKRSNRKGWKNNNRGNQNKGWKRNGRRRKRRSWNNKGKRYDSKYDDPLDPSVGSHPHNRARHFSKFQMAVCESLVDAVPDLTPVSLLVVDFMPPIDTASVRLVQTFPEPLEKGVHMSKLYYMDKCIWSKKTKFYKENGRLGSTHDARLLGDSQLLVYNEAWYTGRFEKCGTPSNKSQEIAVVSLLEGADIEY